jgi:sulfide:quinone oxidoreductase
MSTPHEQETWDVLIVGGGTGGISVASRLIQAGIKRIAIVEPAEDHFYQPLWTLVGGGVVPKEASRKPMRDVIPRGVTWIKARVTKLNPEQKNLQLDSGQALSWSWLVLSPGVEIFWDRVKGLPEALGIDGVCSNYSWEHVHRTWDFIREFRGGKAIFTMPATPVKCGGAPQKIMYLAEDWFRRSQIRSNCDVTFATAGAAIFAVSKYAAALTKICDARNINRLFRHNLIEVRAADRVAVFKHMDTGEEISLSYDLLHVSPPMGAPQFIRESTVANSDGWIDVDAATLRHKRWPHIFALGDASSLPTSKTGAAIRKQAPVLVANLLAARRNEDCKETYDGYTSCPLVTGYGKLILAEFDYAGRPQETFPFDQSKERWSMWLLKKFLLPPLYWYGMLKGRA